LAAEDFTFLLDFQPEMSWPAYLHLLEQRRRGAQVPAGWVPATFLAAVVNGDLMGRVSIRHQLNDYLADVGGHIGYAVRRSHRGCGYATQILRQALVIVRAEGVEDVLVTCEEDNPASATVITRCGGALDDIRVDDRGRRYRRYWIN
jgi:predicted acetyltransferase